MDDTILSNSRLTMDNPRFAEPVAQMIRLTERNPGYLREWKAIAAGVADKDMRARISAAVNVAENKYREGRLDLSRGRLDIARGRLDIDKTNADRNFYLKSEQLKDENDWKPQAALGVADIALKGQRLLAKESRQIGLIGLMKSCLVKLHKEKVRCSSNISLRDAI